MTDEAKALVETLLCVDRGGVLHSRRPKQTHPVCHKAANLIETQAREIERLREALGLADAALRGANINMNVVERKLRAALEARHD